MPNYKTGEETSKENVKKIKERLPKFVQENQERVIDLIKRDMGFNGEVGGEIFVKMDGKNEKIEFKELENKLWVFFKQYLPTAERIKTGKYTLLDLEDIQDCFNKYKKLELADFVKEHITLLEGSLEKLRENYYLKEKMTTLTKKQQEMLKEYAPLDQENFYYSFMRMADSTGLFGGKSSAAIATMHFHGDLKPPSPKDIDNTKDGSISVVISYNSLFIVVPYIIYGGKVEKLPEINLSPIPKKDVK